MSDDSFHSHREPSPEPGEPGHLTGTGHPSRQGLRARRRARRFATPALALACAASFAVPLVITDSAHAAATLRAAAATRSKFIGFAASTSLLTNDASYRGIAQTEFNQVTAENAMKWDATEPNDNQYSFTGADQVVAFAQANNQVVHGHTLVWHSQTPGWVQGLSATAMRTAMQDHITTVVGRYASNPIVQSWDVVNEAFNDDGTRRASFWQNTLGDGYIADAFRFARAADPDAKLCINDYNVEGIGAKSDAMYNLVQSLRAQNVPVDCVGIQGHLGTQYGFPSQVQQNMQRFANLGVQVRITELDVRSVLPMDATKTQTQITYYTNMVNACIAVTACAGITVWGIDDGHSWVPNTFSGQGAALLWDASYNRKSVYDAVNAALDAGGGGGDDTQAPSTPGTPTASGITASSVTLSWTASTDNVGVTGYDIYRAPGASGGTFASVGTATTNSFTNTGLAASTTYRYQVRARDAAGNASGFSAAVAVTTSTGGGTGTGGCTASYSIANQWSGGFQANVTVTNGSAARTGWTVTWTFANGQTITQIWNATDTASGASHTVRNVSYNGNLAANQSVSFGFLGSWNNQTNAVPTLTCG